IDQQHRALFRRRQGKSPAVSSGRSGAIPSTNSAPRKTLDAFPCFLGLQQHPRDRTLHGHGWKTNETSHLLKYLRERTSY
ncbi:hypothetical protein, partial [Pseudomonas aeruginosa]|uniref:hypothetical protein n=1 Tax=Pseudomonas aeruginosa TaxID=287 RepID=UPI001955A002